MNTRPVVAHLLPNYNAFPPIIPAGTELRVEQVGLRQQCYQPVVICGGFPGQLAEEEIGAMSVRRIFFSSLYRRLFQKITRLDPFPYGKRMWQRVQAAHARILHIHNEPKLLAMLSPYLGHQPMPVVVHIANQKPFRSEDIARVRHFVACSQFMATWLIKSYGISPDQVDVIYTGVDVSGRLPWWQIDVGQRQTLRRQWGVDDPEALVFVFGGRLVQEKGVSEMLDAFAYLCQRSERPMRLLVAGNVRESKDRNNAKANYGRAMVKKMANIPGVHWVGSLKPADMHSFLVSGDVFMLPSLWDDPYPTVMLEAAAAGLPIVAAARGGVTEFLQNCPDFEFVKHAEQPESLASVMASLAEAPARRALQGRWLRGVIETQYDWTRVTAEFEALYDRLLTGDF